MSGPEAADGPHTASGAEGTYGPESRYGSESGYGPEPAYGAEQGYGPESRFEPEQGYEPAQGHEQEPTAEGRDGPDGRSSPATRLRRALGEWLLGPTASMSLDRRIELRLSTIIAAGMVVVIVALLVAMAFSTRPKGPPGSGGLGSGLPSAAAPGSGAPGSGAPGSGAMESSWEADAPGAGGAIDASDGAGAGALASGGGLWSGSVGPGDVPEAPAPVPGASRQGAPSSSLRGGALSMPLVRFASGNAGEYRAADPGASGARDPEIRHIEVRQPTEASSGRAPTVPAADPRPDPPDRTYYVIQLRAPESSEIVDRMELHLKGLDFTNTVREPAGRNELGQSLFTLVLGPYLERREADRDCDRLKDAVRRAPFRRGFFLDSYVQSRQPR